MKTDMCYIYAWGYKICFKFIKRIGNINSIDKMQGSVHLHTNREGGPVA